MDETAVGAPPPGDFSQRLIEGFFRRWVLYLLPVAMFAAIGVYVAGNITTNYASHATLSATSNPYLAQPSIRGTELAPLESPANGTARLLNEQLQTDAFIDDLASRAGLVEAIDAGDVNRDDVRNQVSASGVGQNTLQVSAEWADPNIAYLLVEGTIQGYTEILAALAAADSLEAVDFWTEPLVAATENVQAAEIELDTFVAQLPPDPENQGRPTDVALEIERLNASLDRALEAEREAQNRVDEAQLTANQAASTSARQLTIIDAPEIATAPEPVRGDKITAIMVSTMLGVLIAFAALALSSVTDRTIRTRSQLAQAAGVRSVVVVPRIKQLQRTKRTSVPTSDKAA